MKGLIAAIVIAMMVMSLAGCGSKQDPLVGKWVEDAEPAEDLEIFSDGTGILTTFEGMAYSLTSWLAENGRLKLTAQMPLVGESTVIVLDMPEDFHLIIFCSGGSSLEG